MVARMFRTIVFFGLITSAFVGESLDPLVSASVAFSMAIQQQLATTRSDPSPIALAAKTIVYADAKTAYFNALRDAAPELMNVAAGREARPTELVRHDGRGVRGRRRKTRNGSGRSDDCFAKTICSQS